MYCILIVCLLINNVLSTSDEIKETTIERPPTSSPDDDVEILPEYDTSLYLTNYLKNGEYKKARLLARVPSNCPDDDDIIRSYSGYFTVNEKYNSNLHMWYFVAQRKPKHAPVIFYFDAGPHMSTVFSVFTLTSLRINDEMEIECLDDQWNSKYHLVFIDNPVGTGFSFTNSSDGYVTTPTSYTNDLISAFRQFYQMFPHLKRNIACLYGHSYGARYAAHLGARILKEKDNDFNLRNIIIGNAFVGALQQVDYGDFLYNLGLINLKDLQKLEAMQKKLKHQVETKEYACSFETLTSMFYIPSSSGTLIGNLTGFSTLYNFLGTNYNDVYVKRIIKYVSRPNVRCGLHVRQDLQFQVESSAALRALGPDAMKSSVPQLYYALKSNITVLLYNGDYDLFTPYTLMANSLSNMEEYGPLYETASRKKWRILKDTCTDEMIKQWGSCDETLAGYITEVTANNSCGKLVHAYIRGGGHFVTQDQSIRTRSLFDLYLH